MHDVIQKLFLRIPVSFLLPEQRYQCQFYKSPSRTEFNTTMLVRNFLTVLRDGS